MRVVSCMLLLAALFPARAAAQSDRERAEELVREGEELGQQGDYAAALERFQAAEEAAPDPRHDCFISLSYLRLERWTEAALHSDRCRERSGGEAPVPWHEEITDQIEVALEEGGYAPVTVISRPEEATLSQPEVAEGLSTPFTLWLPPGSHRFVAEAGGHHATTEIVSVTSPSPQAVVIELEPIPAPPPTAQPELEPDVPVTDAPRRTPAWVAWTAGVGGAAALAGGVFHATAYRARQRATEPARDYDQQVAILKRDRAIALGLYGVSAVALGGALYAWSRAGSGEPEMRLGVALGPETAHLGLFKQF